MKTIRLLVWTFLLTAALASAALAGDYANFKFIGFSDDGKYLAFEESGEWDGSGGEYATTYFIDVAKNSYAIKPAVYEWGMDGMSESLQAPRSARYKKSVAAGLKKLKIERGNTGKLIAAHLLGDHSFKKPIEATTYFYDSEGNATEKMMPYYDGDFLSPDYDPSTIIFSLEQYPVNPNNEVFYKLKLNQIPSAAPCSPNTTGEDTPKIELTLKSDINHRDIKPQILQKDERIPEARGCPHLYTIEQVYYYEGKIAVFLNVYKRGFEGNDMRYMAITGEIEFQQED
jgi:predicted secreted protein